MYTNRIAHLNEAHRLIETKLTEYEHHPHRYTEAAVAEMKKQKLILKDEISRLQRLQFEEDHERINFDEDNQ